MERETSLKKWRGTYVGSSSEASLRKEREPEISVRNERETSVKMGREEVCQNVEGDILLNGEGRILSE